jgi:hypothetical protein
MFNDDVDVVAANRDRVKQPAAKAAMHGNGVGDDFPIRFLDQKWGARHSRAFPPHSSGIRWQRRQARLIVLVVHGPSLVAVEP